VGTRSSERGILAFSRELRSIVFGKGDRFLKTIIMALILALAPAVPASFASSSGKDYNAHFGDMDTNKDKGVTWDEFKAFFPNAEEGKSKEADGLLTKSKVPC
jgi:hypothetical protein